MRAANTRLIDYFRARSYPLVKAPLPHPTVNHALLTMDVIFSVDPGPKAGFGEVSINGPDGFDPSILRSYIYLQPGQPYTPKALTDLIPAVGSVRNPRVRQARPQRKFADLCRCWGPRTQSGRLHRRLFERRWSNGQCLLQSESVQRRREPAHRRRSFLRATHLRHRRQPFQWHKEFQRCRFLAGASLLDS